MKNFVESIYSKFLNARQAVSTDTRNIPGGCLFFALKGEHFDGNLFAEEAINKGAAFAIVDNKKLPASERFITVDNALDALQQLAHFHRMQLKTKIIALTGSNGKTTTKELIHAVLSRQYKTLATQGNLNNHIGVPLTLLSLTAEHEFAVVEMGANHRGEIAALCNIALPDSGLITNIGKAHLEGFGGLEGVKKGKEELYDFLKKNSGTLFMNADNPILTEMMAGYKNVVTYGTKNNADYQGGIEPSSQLLKIHWHQKNSAEKFVIQSSLAGNYNFENIMAAVCIGNYAGVDKENIRWGIENYVPSNQRSQVVEKNSNTLILDYYNANPSSMEAALVNLEKNYSGKKIAILGDMLELGAESDAEHEGIVNLLKKLNFAHVILIGKSFGEFSDSINADFFDTAAEAVPRLAKQNFNNAVILIKGSRGLKMEKVMEAFGV